MRGNIIWARFADHGVVTRSNITDWKRTIARQEKQLKIAKELAAKVRGYFTDPDGGVHIEDQMNGDRDLYELASKLTKRSIQPGTKEK